MKHWSSFPSVQIVLCLAVYGFVGWRMGPFVFVWTSPLLAAAIARPLLSLVANFRHGVRSQVWLPVHGQHYVFKGITIHVQEDDDRCRWVPLADVRKVAGITAGEGALAMTYPQRFMPTGKSQQAHLRDDALIEHLGKQSNPVALRFRTWLERTVAFPGQRIRKNLGIRPEPPYSE
jgi:hypothetical protein